MHRFPAFARDGLEHTFPIWEPVRFGARFTGATVASRALTKRPGSERAAEAPLGARE
jgi:hypothetical protein